MNSNTRGLVVATILAASVAAAAPASATVWNFADHGTGDLGANAATFSADDGTTLNVFSGVCTGSTVGSRCDFGPDLYYKSGGAGETGLGLVNDPDHEIPAPYAVAFSTAGYSSDLWRVTVGSLAGGDSASIVDYGPGEVAAVLATFTGGANVQSTGLFTVAPVDTIAVIDNHGNVLLTSVTLVGVPEPAMLFLLGIGLLGMAMIRLRG